jgi:PKD repeat protein
MEKEMPEERYPPLMTIRLGSMLCILVFLMLTGSVADAGTVDYLETVQDQFHQTFDVYTDADAAGNHFSHRGMIAGQVSTHPVPAMEERETANPFRGLTCIRASFGGAGATWGGWYFMNGVLQGTDTIPRANWGTVPDAGIDLRGATTLTFYARGAQGGERVEFFAFNVGRDEGGNPIAPYPDSSRKVSTGYITLTSQWKKYSISLSGRDLSSVLGGFGWVSSMDENGGRPITFFIDDITYDLPRLDEPRFLQSYRTINSGSDFDLVMSNAGYTYDNAVALLAFLAEGTADGRRRAGLIADAFVYAQEHDRYFTDGRVRNAYQAGDLVLWPGWKPNGKAETARMPGWWDRANDTWYEDSVQAGTYTGNMAWTGLALLAYYNTTNDPKYLQSAVRLGDWVLLNCDDPVHPGFTGGFERWEPAQTILTYKSTEHNMDLYALFRQLYAITGDARWSDAAGDASTFVLSMWDPVEGKFWTGTLPDGVTPNRGFVPMDVQAWAVQSMGDVIPRADLLRALDYVETKCRVDGGYDFNTDRDGVWPEGTAQMAVSNGLIGRFDRACEIIAYLHSIQNADGSMDAASRDGLTTGINLSDGSPWLYYKRAHVGATGWLALAETWTNPFYYTTVVHPEMLPDRADLPNDLDGDGRCEDVNGNGRRDFADVVLYFNQMTWIGTNEPRSLFDYNGNGRVDFADVTWLFNNL